MHIHRGLNELGENGYLLMQNIILPELNMDNDNSNAILKHTQSCQLPIKKTQTKTKITKRRNTV